MDWCAEAVLGVNSVVDELALPAGLRDVAFAPVENAGDSTAPEPWGFPVPRPTALLLDRLTSPFSVLHAVDEGATLDLDEGDGAEAVEARRRHEIVSDGPEGQVKHPENRN